VVNANKENAEQDAANKMAIRPTEIAFLMKLLFLSAPNPRRGERPGECGDTFRSGRYSQTKRRQSRCRWDPDSKQGARSRP
jgi:hypothetical protein